MVDGGCFVLQPSDCGDPVVGPVGVRAVVAGSLEVDRRLTSDGISIHRALNVGVADVYKAVTVGGADGLARLIRVLRRGRWVQLVNVALAAEVRALAAHVGEG